MYLTVKQILASAEHPLTSKEQLKFIISKLQKLESSK